VTLDLADFKVNEISVKIVDNSLVVHAEHEEKPDEAGHVYRKLNRRYILPRAVNQDNISSTFSDNGTLVITAPKKLIEKSVRGSLLLVLDWTIFQIFSNFDFRAMSVLSK
jgi:HSP20 family molecular chaperone IbpA